MTTEELLKTATPRPWRRGKELGEPGYPSYRVEGKTGLAAISRAAGGPRSEAKSNADLVVRAVNSFEVAREEIRNAIGTLEALDDRAKERATFHPVDMVERLKSTLALMEGEVPHA